MRKPAPKRNTTNLQCAGLVASIGCPRIWEICNDFGRKLSRRRYIYRTEEAAAKLRDERAADSVWSFAEHQKAVAL